MKLVSLPPKQLAHFACNSPPQNAAGHALRPLSPEDELLRDPDGTLAVRLCNFELLRRLD